jgi:hypothetical protein
VTLTYPVRVGEPLSLMEFVKLLLRSDHERAGFAADPDGALAHHGLSDLSPADVHDAVLLVQDTLTVDWSQAYGTGAGAAHTAPVAEQAPHDTIGWFLSDEPDPGGGQTVASEHPMPPGIVDDVLYDAPDLHFGH